MIYQAYGLSPNQTIFDFNSTSQKQTGNITISTYRAPFSFFINGNTNFYGCRIKIYTNDENKLVYDSGPITKALISSANENESTITPYTAEYNIYPIESGNDNINITPILPNGENVKINIFLPTQALLNNIEIIVF